MVYYADAEVPLLVETREVRVIEAYRDYDPRLDVSSVVRRLLETVPEKYLHGLDCVILNNFSGLSRNRRIGKLPSKGKRIARSNVLGLYRREWMGTPASIELHVDKIIASAERQRVPLWLPLARDWWFAETLYHELGHHVHHAVRPEYKEKEDVADDWQLRFSRNFLRKKYWYTFPLVWTAVKIYKLLRPKPKATSP